MADTETETKGDHTRQTAELKGHMEDESVNVNSDYIRFWPFFKALQEKDWEGVIDFVGKDKDNLALTSNFRFSYYEETLLHLITRNLNVPIWVLKKFVSMIEPQSLELENEFGKSPLFMAALSGNINAAKIFVEKNKNLPNIRSNKGYGLLPIQSAAKWGHKEIIQYLWERTTASLERGKKSKGGFYMLKDLINSGHYDIAFKLLKRYPTLAREKNEDRGTILEMLAGRPSAFKSGTHLGRWERKIYEWIPMEEHNPGHRSAHADEENPVEKFKFFESIKRHNCNAYGALLQKLRNMIWQPLIQVPCIKSLHNAKLTHMQALGIVRMMCHDGVTWIHKEAFDSLWLPLNSATRLGIYELVNEILKAYYFSYGFCDEKEPKHGILHLAIKHRQEEVFSLITNMNLFHWNWKAACKHVKADNFLHLAAINVPSSQVPGAALQMQRELEWFKAVQCFVHPSLQEQQNRVGKTPREVFTEKHKKLVEEGEKWMKDTATSCTVVAALIITVVFAAAFTVPGGNDADGFPLFLHQVPFIIFIISDALAFFSSTALVFMFLGILSSRYSEEDFLESLPRKLIIGLITLFVSVASMVTAFTVAIYILLSDLRSAVFIPIALLGGVTVIIFARLQFPLLIEMYSSTYRSILHPPRK